MAWTELVELINCPPTGRPRGSPTERGLDRCPGGGHFSQRHRHLGGHPKSGPTTTLMQLVNSQQIWSVFRV